MQHHARSCKRIPAVGYAYLPDLNKIWPKYFSTMNSLQVFEAGLDSISNTPFFK